MSVGIRAPFLQVGWNRQFLMMSEFGFAYDSSIVAPFSDPPLWPYTLDYKPPHPCIHAGQVCPTRSYPNIWELPLNQLLANVSKCHTRDRLKCFSFVDKYQVKMESWDRITFNIRALLLHARNKLRSFKIYVSL